MKMKTSGSKTTKTKTKRLFNEYEAASSEAQVIEAKFRQAIEPIINEAVEQGFELRDISNVLSGELLLVIAEKVLIRAMQKRKALTTTFASKRSEKPRNGDQIN